MTDDASVLVYRRGDEDQNAEDIWDDTALIEAYDRAVGEAKEEIKRRHSSLSASGSVAASSSSRSQSSNSQKRKHKQKSPYKAQPRQWKAGDACRAVYSVDGILYEAFIESRDPQDKSRCRVVFVGYGNTEDVPVANLLPSKGKQARRRQTREAEACGQNVKVEPVDSAENEANILSATSEKKSTFQHWQPPGQNWSMPSMGTIPPPPPPPPFDDDDEDSEALATMLLSWYMSGYHTGYYQAQKRFQSSASGHGRRN